MLTTTAPTIDATGIHAPAYADILAFLTAQFQQIYGADVYLGNDSQDGQFLAIIAQAINDSNSACVAVYNAYSPATAQGNGLSSAVKINGLARLLPSSSTASLVIVGTVGTIIVNGVVKDGNGVKWDLPEVVTIPNTGTIIVTATCETAGAVSAPANSITNILTPTLGWNSVTNPAIASVGQPLETDAQLRNRQSISTALPSLTVLQGIIGAVAAVPNVTRYAGYENDTDATNSLGLPPHSIAIVIEGGDATAIATAIARKKTPGVNAYGTTVQTIPDGNITYNAIGFFVPTEVPITVGIQLHALAGYTTTVANEIKAAVAAYINSLPIGQAVYLSRLYVAANLAGVGDAPTFEIIPNGIMISTGGPIAPLDIPIAFNAVASCNASLVAITTI